LRFEPLEDRRVLSITVDTLDDLADGNISPGHYSLREAIGNAVAGETINISVAGTIALSNLGQLNIDKSLTIHGPGANLLTIRAFDPNPGVSGNGTRIFNINDGVDASLLDVEISGLTLTGGDSILSRGGGAIFSRENLNIADSIITGNRSAINPMTSSGSGGGISLLSGNLLVTNCTIRDNVAEESGGGIYTLGANVTILDSTISGNVTSATSGYGGGIYCQDELTVTRSTISGNSAGMSGAGISNRSGNISISGSNISGNISGYFGGGISFNSSSYGLANVSDTVITGNRARFGGGIYGLKQGVTLTGCTISGNTAELGAAFAVWRGA
jgi:predicted outer membrane repeat protein